MGRDEASGRMHVDGAGFQSTRPRGARRILCSFPTPCSYFNPRARVGRDVSLALTLMRARNFNPRARVGRDRIDEQRLVILW